MHFIPGDPLFGTSLACKQKSRNVTWWNKIKFCFTARHLVEILSKHGLKIRFKNVALFLVFMIIEYVLWLVNVPLCCIKYEGCKPILWHITDDEPTNDIIHHRANSESVFWSDGEIWTHDHSKQNWDNGLYAFTVRIRRETAATLTVGYARTTTVDPTCVLGYAYYIRSCQLCQVCFNHVIFQSINSFRSFTFEWDSW